MTSRSRGFVINLDKIRPYLNSDTLFICIFIFCLILHIHNSFVGWNNTILDHFGFRQAQTAISSFYMIKEGFHLNYITPVLGAPWSIPIEFPIFQWIVALIVIIFKSPLDQTGRFVSLIFFYSSLIPLFLLLRHVIKNTGHRYILLTMVLLNPIYIFWSRAFMIESIALFFSLMFAYYFTQLFYDQSARTIICAIIFGSLAGLTKITTFVCFMPAAFGIYLLISFEHKKYLPDIKSKLLILSSAILLPLAVSIIWSGYADSVKSLNPFAYGFINSKALVEWTFGTIAQRLSPDTWTQIFINASVLVPIFGNIATFLVSILLIFLNRKRAIEIMLFFSLFMAGPLIFTNLYYVHDYYFYANSIFISVMFGLMVIAFLENRSFKYGAVIAMILFYVFSMNSYKGYESDFYMKQVRNNDYVSALCNTIKMNTNEQDVILIYGSDWDSSIPYYAERKALMDRWDLPLSDPKLGKALNNLGGREKIKAMIIGGYAWDYKNTYKNNAFISEKIKFFNLSPMPAYKDKTFTLYIARNGHKYI